MTSRATHLNALAALAALAFAAIAACSASPRSSEQAAQAPPAYLQVADRSDRVAEINEMASQIRDWRRQIGLSLEPEESAIIEMRPQPLSTAMRICPDDYEPVTEQCQDVCSLANAICENADSICRIASDLPGDTWAEGKCDSSKASCKQAKERCCTCENGTGHSTGTW